MSSVDQYNNNIDAAELACDITSNIAWAIPGAEPVGAVITVLGLVFGTAKKAVNDNQPSNQKLLDAILELEADIDKEPLKTVKADVEALNARLKTDADILQAYKSDENGLEGYFLKKRDSDHCKAYYDFIEAQQGDFDITPVVNALTLLTETAEEPNDRTAPDYSSKYSEYIKDLAACQRRLTLYILGQSYLHLYYYNRLVIIRTIHDWNNQDSQYNDWSECTEEGAENYKSKLRISLEDGLNFALPKLIALKKAFLDRPSESIKIANAFPATTQSYGPAFRKYSVDNYLDQISEAEVDAHLRTMEEWKKTLALKLKAPYKGADYKENKQLSFLFECQADGTPVDPFSNSELCSGSIAIQHAQVLPLDGYSKGADDYYQFPKDGSFGKVLSTAGQLEAVNDGLEAAYDEVNGDGSRKATFNSGNGYQHSRSKGMLTGTYLTELASAKPIGSDVCGIVFSMVPPCESNDPTKFSREDEVNFGNVYYNVLASVASWNERSSKWNANHCDRSPKPIFKAVRLDWPIKGKDEAADRCLANLVLLNLQYAARDCSRASAIAIILPAEARQAFIEAGPNRDAHFAYNMRGFQLPPQAEDT